MASGGAVSLLITIYATCRIHQLLLSGIERMAGRANVDVDRFHGRPRLVLCAAGARNNGVEIFWMYLFSHDPDSN